MGKNSELVIEEAENFYSRLEENEEYATVSMTMSCYDYFIRTSWKDEYYVHGVKQNNPEHKKDNTLKDLYSKKRKLNKEITKREQNLNHEKK